jgi:hypothetical protein
VSGRAEGQAAQGTHRQDQPRRSVDRVFERRRRGALGGRALAERKVGVRADNSIERRIGLRRGVEETIVGTLMFFGEPAEKVRGSKPVHAAEGYYDEPSAPPIHQPQDW